MTRQRAGEAHLPEDGHEFFITTHERLPGVFLSCAGGWGNVPYPQEDAAIEAIEVVMGGHPYRVTREGVGKRGRRLGRTDPAWLTRQR